MFYLERLYPENLMILNESNKVNGEKVLNRMFPLSVISLPPNESWFSFDQIYSVIYLLMYIASHTGIYFSSNPMLVHMPIRVRKPFQNEENCFTWR